MVDGIEAEHTQWKTEKAQHVPHRYHEIVNNDTGGGMVVVRDTEQWIERCMVALIVQVVTKLRNVDPNNEPVDVQQGTSEYDRHRVEQEMTCRDEEGQNKDDQRLVPRFHLCV